MNRVLGLISFGVFFVSTVALSQTNPRALDDLTLAMSALKAIGADVPDSTMRCAGCHTLDSKNIRRWAQQFNLVNNWCLNPKDSGKTALERINCLKSDPSNPNSEFHPSRLALWAGAVQLPQFETLFNEAYGAEGHTKHQDFMDKVSMPRNGNPGFTQDEFDLVKEWIRRDLVRIEQILGAVPYPDATCNETQTPDLKPHVVYMSTHGWSAINKQKNLLMFGCVPGNDSSTCFQMKNADGVEIFPLTQNIPELATINQNSSGWSIRQLTKLLHQTNYWLRSSADGRFIGSGIQNGPTENGTGYGAAIVDLMPDLSPKHTRKIIYVKANFDPSFFADNSGFAFQGATNFCNQKILYNEDLKFLDFTNPECTSLAMGLYHSSGVGLNGSDYLAINGNFRADTGNENGEFEPGWTSQEVLAFTPFRFDGSVFKPLQNFYRRFAFQGDFILSPSSTMLISRTAGKDSGGRYVQTGYNLSSVRPNVIDGRVTYDVAPLGHFCGRGAKGSFSHDERFVTFHKSILKTDFADFGYTSPTDPEFAKYYTGVTTTNVYVRDLYTQKEYRLTTVPPGYKAVHPHFRTDGWMYFQLKHDLELPVVLATDIALRLKQATPIVE